jgi:cytosolic carboxypeptidase protein 2/3
MKGIIEFLTSETSEEAQALRKNFVFKIIPMINVDGVMYGNYRCSLSGIDLNRTWKRIEPTLFPEVASIKKVAEEFNQEHKVVLCCDLHGHSRARRVFMYGNNYVHNPESTRLFPYILSKLEPQMFDFKKCKFSISKNKEGTSRIALWILLKMPSVYTLEASLCGSSINSKMPHFTPQNLMNMGKKLCLAILIQNDIQLASVTEPILRQNFSREQLARELIEDNELNSLADANEEDSEVMSECSGGSDSDPGQDTLTT